MTKTYSFSYVGCRGCKAGSQCGQCETRLEEAIMGLDGITGAAVQMGAKQLTVDGSMGEDKLLTSFEHIGILAR